MNLRRAGVAVTRAINLRYPRESWADYFVGWVPAGMILKMNLDNLAELIKSRARVENRVNASDTAFELSLIGAVAYLECFFRDQWASVVNICPRLLYCLEERGRQIRISPLALFELNTHPLRQLGSAVSEQFDFGTARAVNSAYKDLLGITPIGKRDSTKLDSLLHDRNLLVHYGGVFRFQHKNPGFIASGARRRYADSVIVTAPTALKVCGFMAALAQKTMDASASAAHHLMEQMRVHLTREGRKAFDFLTVWE